MTPDQWILVASVLIAGGAMGSAGTLLAQFVFRQIRREDDRKQPSLEAAEIRLLKAEVQEFQDRLNEYDARLDFTEQLLGGDSPTSLPSRLTAGSLPVEVSPGPVAAPDAGPNQGAANNPEAPEAQHPEAQHLETQHLETQHLETQEGASGS